MTERLPQLWWAAHLLQCWRRMEDDAPVLALLVWENVVLISAATEEDAWRRAWQLGRKQYDPPLCESIATWQWIYEMRGINFPLDSAIGDVYISFLGVCKLVPCANPASRPGDGTEISHAWYRVPDMQAIPRLSCEEPASLSIESFPLNDAASYRYFGQGAYPPCTRTPRVDYPWQTAHLLMHCDFHDGGNTPALLLEKLHLVCSETDQQAADKARLIGEASETDDFRVGGRSATLRFLGILRLIKCDAERIAYPPRHGREVTYYDLKLHTIDDLAKYLRREAVTIEYWRE